MKKPIYYGYISTIFFLSSKIHENNNKHFFFRLFEAHLCWQRKKFKIKIKGADLVYEAYFSYVAMTKDEAL